MIRRPPYLTVLKNSPENKKDLSWYIRLWKSGEEEPERVGEYEDLGRAYRSIRERTVTEKRVRYELCEAERDAGGNVVSDRVVAYKDATGVWAP